jgi:uncharacterized protein YjbI with pentapeptide repeats
MKKTQEELDQILQQHQLWLDTEGGTGQRAELRYANLTGANLYNANLYGVLLCNANLTGANLHGADLRRVDFFGANLRDARFDTNIKNCRSFRCAKFTSDALPWLILHPRWAELKASVQIKTE